MRPDRLVVGEVRGPEVVDLLSALNTGHDGGCGTLHANSAGDVPARLEVLGVTAGLERDAVHTQAAAALDIVVHVIKDASGRRRVAELSLLSRPPERGLVTVPALRTGTDGELLRGPGAAGLDVLLANGRKP